MAKIDHIYHNLLSTILEKGFTYEDPNRKGVNRLQVQDYRFEHSFKDGFPAITTKKLAWKSVVGETLWILRGDTNIKYLLNNKIPIWNKDAYNYYLREHIPEHGTLTQEEFIELIKQNEKPIYHELGDLGKVYGHQLRRFGGEFDQLEWMLKTLLENPMATKKHVSYINPNDKEHQALTPCHTGWKILTRPLSPVEIVDQAEKEGIWEDGSGFDADLFKENSNGQLFHEFIGEKQSKLKRYAFKLEFTMDSVDTFLGLPFNIASYALLAKIIGKMVNMVPEGIIGNLSNVHIYEPHLGAVKKQLDNDPYKHGQCNLKMSDDVEYLFEYYRKPKVDNDLYYKRSGALDTVLNKLNINDFTLDGYKSYPLIKAEMLAYDN